MLIQEAGAALKAHVPLTEAEIHNLLEVPPSPDLGDLAFPCFVLAKLLKKAPPLIAKEIAAAVDSQEIAAEAAGAYVNLRFNRCLYFPKLFQLLESDDHGTLKIGQEKTVVIDMSSPNIAKPFGIGHLRSTVIGAALYRMYEAAGYKVISVNHLGDWGTQFGKQITAFKHWGNEELLQKSPIEESLKLYVRFHEEAENNPALEDEARDWFRKLEAGDPEAVSLWKYFVEVSMAEFNRMYERLGVRFDYVLGESFYNDKMGAVIEQLREKNLLVESEGALVVRLDDLDMPPCLILKKDGTTIYPTRDLATAIYRREVMGADQLLYVVGGEQQLHFKQVFAVLNKMKKDWSAQCLHVPFGLMKFEGKKMSTRRGKIIVLEEVLDEAVQRALQVIEQKNPQLPDKQEVAEMVGIGAVIFGDLKNNRMNEVDFSLDEALQFDGETGPYVQYTYVRTQSVLAKGELTLAENALDPAVEAPAPEVVQEDLLGDSGWELLKQLVRYPIQLERALKQNEPSVMARYTLELAQLFNQFYNRERIIIDEQKVREARLQLTRITGCTLAKALKLLGIGVPERM